MRGVTTPGINQSRSCNDRFQAKRRVTFDLLASYAFTPSGTCIQSLELPFLNSNRVSSKTKPSWIMPGLKWKKRRKRYVGAVSRCSTNAGQFFYIGKAFLSLLATIEGVGLSIIQASLLPHTLTLGHPPYGADSREAIRLSISNTQGIESCSQTMEPLSIVGRASDASMHDSIDTEGSDLSCVGGKRPGWLDRMEHATPYTIQDKAAATWRSRTSLDTCKSLFTGTVEDAAFERTLEGVTSLHSMARPRLASVSPSILSSNWDANSIPEAGFTLPEGVTVTRWLYAYNQLSRLYGDSYEEIQHIVEIGDSFLRDDATNFINLFCSRWDAEDPWSRLPTSNPVTGTSLAEKMLKSLQCVEILSADSLIEPIKLRMARVLLYHQYEQELIRLKHDPSPPVQLSSGKGIASVAKSVILERVYGSHYKDVTAEVRRKHENSLKWHTRIGKRWSYVVSHLGLGIILTCSHRLEIHV